MAITMKADLQKVCVYWNVDQNAWDTNGCNLLEEHSNKQMAVCSCSHLTNFALIMGDGNYEDDIQSTFNTISRLLGLVSCVFLVVTQFFKHFVRCVKLNSITIYNINLVNTNKRILFQTYCYATTYSGSQQKLLPTYFLRTFYVCY